MNGNERRVEKARRLAGVEPSFQGKVRDIYDLGDMLIIVSTDRISAYDSILPTLITGKGIILNMMSAAWFDRFGKVPNHMLSTKVEDFPAPFNRFAAELGGRSMLVRKARRIDLECVVRGYIAGSGWKEYSGRGTVCGIELPPGLRHSERLEEDIFTPSTKAERGHDENISLERASEIVGSEVVDRIREISLGIYEDARLYAASKGIIIADTKFEFGRVGDEIVLVDELLTPDSSRFWIADEYEPGRPQNSLDKQFVRDYLDEVGWDHSPPAPALPDEIVRKTFQRYRMALDSLFEDSRIERFLQ